MRARFNHPIDGNIGRLIFSHLEVVDLCMARATCRAWRVLIPPVRPSMMRDFVEVVPRYDSDLYIHALERWTSWDNYKYECTTNFGIWDRLVELRVAHTFMLFTRISGIRNDPNAMWAICSDKPEYWNTVLLPYLYCVSLEEMLSFFWDSFYTESLDLLKWMIERNLIDLKFDEIFNYWWGPPSEECRSISFIHTNPRVPPIFLERLEAQKRREDRAIAKRPKTQKE